MADAEVSFDTMILCDDIRMEQSGKFLLIGVYSTEIGTANFPATFTFYMHTQGDVTKAGKSRSKFYVKDMDGNTIFRPVDNAALGEPEFTEGRFAINTNMMFTLHKPGLVQFSVDHNGNEQILGVRDFREGDGQLRIL